MHLRGNRRCIPSRNERMGNLPGGGKDTYLYTDHRSLDRLQSPVQKNIYDCGMFVIGNLFQLLTGKQWPKSFTQRQIDNFREFYAFWLTLEFHKAGSPSPSVSDSGEGEEAGSHEEHTEESLSDSDTSSSNSSDDKPDKPAEGNAIPLQLEGGEPLVDTPEASPARLESITTASADHHGLVDSLPHSPPHEASPLSLPLRISPIIPTASPSPELRQSEYPSLVSASHPPLLSSPTQVDALIQISTTPESTASYRQGSILVSTPTRTPSVFAPSPLRTPSFLARVSLRDAVFSSQDSELTHGGCNGEETMATNVINDDDSGEDEVIVEGEKNIGNQEVSDIQQRRVVFDARVKERQFREIPNDSVSEPSIHLNSPVRTRSQRYRINPHRGFSIMTELSISGESKLLSMTPLRR